MVVRRSWRVSYRARDCPRSAPGARCGRDESEAFHQGGRLLGSPGITGNVLGTYANPEGSEQPQARRLGTLCQRCLVFGSGGKAHTRLSPKVQFPGTSPIFPRIRAYANGSPVCSWASQAAELRRPKRVEGLLEHMLPSRSGGIAGPGTVLTIGFRESLRAFLSRRSSKPAGRVAPDNQIPTTSLADPLQVEESHSVFGSMHRHSPLKAALAVWIGSLQPFVPARISA
jgi:hypothetical protein